MRLRAEEETPQGREILAEGGPPSVLGSLGVGRDLTGEAGCGGSMHQAWKGPGVAGGLAPRGNGGKGPILGNCV